MEGSKARAAVGVAWTRKRSRPIVIPRNLALAAPQVHQPLLGKHGLITFEAQPIPPTRSARTQRSRSWTSGTLSKAASKRPCGGCATHVPDAVCAVIVSRA